MSHETRIIFDHFCLDRSNECLWKGPQVIKLRPKAYAVLNQLIARSGQLVTKEELLATVWPETFVGDAVLKVTIRQLRDALDDDPKSPAFMKQHTGEAIASSVGSRRVTRCKPALKSQ